MRLPTAGRPPQRCPERRRRAARRACAGAALVALLALAGAASMPAAARAASVVPSPTADPHAGEPWWLPLGLRGQALSAVTVSGSDLEVIAGDHDLVSSDGGVSFQPAPAGRGGHAGADVRSGGDEWWIRGGRILHARTGGLAAADPGAPDLGAGAHLLAAPVATPGVVVAVSDAGLVWRRTATGDWGPALLLLPGGLISGAPRITDLTAFAAAVPGGGTPASVYLATDGYSVLATNDAGDDWFRDGPGLPDHVSGLAPSSARSAIYAATDDGLWVHHLRALPGIPEYAASDLGLRQRAVAAVTLVVCALGAAALLLVMRRRPGWAR